MSFVDRLRNVWNAFTNRDSPQLPAIIEVGSSSSYRPDRVYFSPKVERTIVTSVFNRIATDCASLKVRHVRTDDDGRYLEEIDSDLNERFTVFANKDQQSQEFMQDVVMSLLDDGCIAICPIDTEDNPDDHDSVKIYSLRVGKILQWYPDFVQVEAYNDRTGQREQVMFSKNAVAIIENPFYSIMNEKNSTLQRLLRKLTLLDVVDEQSGSGKLDLIVSLPYSIKSEMQKKQAETRRQNLEQQLNNSKYGIVYTDATEKVTQLNRPVENNLMKQVEYLTSMLYGQIGVTIEILNGTANEATMTNYYKRVIEPIMSRITKAMNWKFLSKTARTQNQAIMYFDEPFKLVPVTNIAEVADKFTRNEIMSSNEIRQIVGLKPSKDPAADELRNKNISEPSGGKSSEEDSGPLSAEEMKRIDSLPFKKE